MKNLSALMVAGLATLILTGCGSSSLFTVEYFPFQEKEDGKWGMMNAEGEVLFSSEFKFDISPVVNDRFSAIDKNGLHEYYEASDKLEAIEKGEKYNEAAAFTGKYAPVLTKKNKIVYINKDGEVAIDLEKKYPKKEITGAGSFFNDRAIVRMDDKYGFIDTDGKLVIPCKYDLAYEFFNDVTLCIDKDNKKLYFVDKNGNAKATKKYEEGYNCNICLNNYFMIEDADNKQTIYDADGQEVLKLGEKEISGFIFDDKFVFEEDDELGLMDISGKVLIKAKYEYLNYNGALIACGQDEKWFLLDEDGDKKSDKYDGIINLFPFYVKGHDSYFTLYDMDDKKLILYGEDGEEVELDFDIYNCNTYIPSYVEKSSYYNEDYDDDDY